MKTFVEVGANDGSEQSKTAELIKKGWKALLIEPCSYYYDKLVDRYADNDQVLCHNVAIASQECDKEMFYIHPDEIVAKGLPAWAGLLGSFSLEHIRKHIFDPNIQIVKETVRCISLNDSLKTNDIKDIDLLSVDAEGADYDVIQTIDLDTYKPRYIEIEIKHLSRSDLKALKGLLSAKDYAVASLTDIFGNSSFFCHKPLTRQDRPLSGRKAVAVFADKRFLPGLQVMVHSLLKHTELDTTAWELVVLSNDLEDNDLDKVRCMWSNTKIRKFDAAKYAGINQNLKEKMPGANGSYHKFELFGMDEYDKVVALDADLLFLQDVSELFESDASIAAVKEMLIDQFNTGVMVIGKDNLGSHVVDALIEATEILGPREHADQDTISAYFYQEMTELPVVFNFLKTYYNYPFLHKFKFPPHIRVLHFIIHKPWLWDGGMNEIEIGTEQLNQMWVDEFNDFNACHSCQSCKA